MVHLTWHDMKGKTRKNYVICVPFFRVCDSLFLSHNFLQLHACIILFFTSPFQDITANPKNIYPMT